VFNVGYEEVAIRVASAVQADKLIVFTPESLAGLPRELPIKAAEKLPAPWRALAETACNQGIARLHLIPDRLAGGCLLELYTRDGCGVMIHANEYEQLRNATFDDIGGILALLAPLEQAGIVLPRSRAQLELDIAQYIVIERDDNILGCCALLPYYADNCMEFAAVAVHPDAQKRGYARRLLAECEQRARQNKITTLLALTVSAEHWFIEQGFTAVGMEALPAQRRSQYKTTRNAKIFGKNL
jgi:amino-acid N-acetyltransferase